jgi:polyvinyl alcohol dehydrogenase (cytochrome)
MTSEGMMSHTTAGRVARALLSFVRISWAAAAAATAAVLLWVAGPPMVTAAPPSVDWPMFGQNLSNTAAAPAGTRVRDPRRLRLKWTFTTAGDVSARAAVVNGVAYFPDWGGYLWAVNANNGKLVWSHPLSDYGLPANACAHEPCGRGRHALHRHAGRRVAAGHQRPAAT